MHSQPRVPRFFALYRSCKENREVIVAMGGTNRPIVVTSSIGSSNTVLGILPMESNPAASSSVFPRVASDEAAFGLADKGIRAVMMRNSQIHNTVRQGVVSGLIEPARKKGSVSAQQT